MWRRALALRVSEDDSAARLAVMVASGFSRKIDGGELSCLEGGSHMINQL